MKMNLVVSLKVGRISDLNYGESSTFRQEIAEVLQLQAKAKATSP